MRVPSNLPRLVALGLVCGLGVLATAPAANAYYVGPGPVVVAPPPAYVVRPPRVVYAPYPRAHWVRPHYDRFGRFIPGHWA